MLLNQIYRIFFNKKKSGNKRFWFFAAMFLLVVSPVFAQQAPAVHVTENFWGVALAILGAAVATLGGGYGSSVGVGISGEVGDGVLSEDSNKFGSVLILQALPMTQSIYGMLIAFIIFSSKLTPNMPTDKGAAILFAALPIAVVGYISGVWQGKVSAASIQLIARKPKQMMQAVMLPTMVETFAVFALLVSILLLGKIS